jgi:hypothetical protein
MSFGSNGVEQVRLLQKILTPLRLANLCINGASSATKRFGTPKNMSFGTNGLDQVHSLRKILT